MDWIKDRNCIRHNSGFAVIVEQGTFEMPYEVTFISKNDIPPIEATRMLRTGLQIRQRIERSQKKRVTKTSNDNRHQLSLKYNY